MAHTPGEALHDSLAADLEVDKVAGDLGLAIPYGCWDVGGKEGGEWVASGWHVGGRMHTRQRGGGLADNYVVLLITHYSLLTSHCSLLSLLTTRYLLLTGLVECEVQARILGHC